MYQGKDEVRPPNVSAMEYPTYRLLMDPIWHQKGMCCCLKFEDNWFSSYDVVRMLKQRGIEYVATFCQSRKGD